MSQVVKDLLCISQEFELPPEDGRAGMGSQRPEGLPVNPGCKTGRGRSPRVPEGADPMKCGKG